GDAAHTHPAVAGVGTGHRRRQARSAPGRFRSEAADEASYDAEGGRAGRVHLPRGQGDEGPVVVQLVRCLRQCRG
ncbi:hypothetical protein THAOC_04033, partial [Thalassiosira oceanica]